MKSYQIRLTGLLTCILLFQGMVCLCLADGPASTRDIRIDNQRLWINVKQTRLDYVLTEIARQMKIRIEFYGKSDRKITARLDNRPIEKGLEELLAQTNFSFVYQQVPSGKPGETVLKKVVIITTAAGSDPVFFDSGPVETGARIKTVINVPSPAPTVSELEEKVSTRPPDTIYGTGVSRKLAREQAGRMAARNLFASAGAIPAVLNAQLSRSAGEEGTGDTLGLAIGPVDPDSGLASLGFEQGDVIRNINGDQVPDAQKAEKIIQESLQENGGGMIRIEVERQGIIEPIYIEIQ